MKSPVSTIVAIGTGLIILAGYFVPVPSLTQVRSQLLTWAVLVAAFALWIGVFNLLAVHWKKTRSHRPDAPYSIVLLAAFGLTLVYGILENLVIPNGAGMQQTVSSIQVPVEASLLAILSVTLLYAGARLLSQRRDTLAVLFLISAVIFLILGSGLLSSFDVPLLNDLSLALNRLPVSGMRGILLGVALGSLATGLRVLMGSDRPYRG